MHVNHVCHSVFSGFTGKVVLVVMVTRAKNAVVEASDGDHVAVVLPSLKLGVVDL